MKPNLNECLYGTLDDLAYILDQCELDEQHQRAALTNIVRNLITMQRQVQNLIIAKG